MKLTHLGLAVCVAAMSTAHIDAATYKSVVINHTDGSRTAIAIENGMTTCVADGHLNLSCAKGDISYPVQDVTGWTFSTASGDSDRWAGIDSPTADDVLCAVESDRIVFDNLPYGSVITLTTSDGRTVSRTVAQGQYELSLTGVIPGIYIVTFNDKSIKIATGR